MSCAARGPGTKAKRWPPTRFSIETGLPVYFCDPRSPWQRGSNENTVSVSSRPDWAGSVRLVAVSVGVTLENTGHPRVCLSLDPSSLSCRHRPGSLVLAGSGACPSADVTLHSAAATVTSTQAGADRDRPTAGGQPQ